VLNKADLMGGVDGVTVKSGAIAVSAITGEGLDDLARMIDARIASAMEVVDYLLPPSDGARLAWLYEHGEVIGRSDAEETIMLQVRLTPSDRARFEQI
jgi:GTP-binding protein HflX